MGGISRRTFLQGAAATTGGVMASGSLQTLMASAASAHGAPSFELAAVADLRDQIVRLWLPPGFRYRSFHDTDVPTPVVLPDGTTLPGRHDGMGAFRAPDGNVWLVRNHELNNPATPGNSMAFPRFPRSCGRRRTGMCTSTRSFTTPRPVHSCRSRT